MQNKPQQSSVIHDKRETLPWVLNSLFLLRYLFCVLLQWLTPSYSPQNTPFFKCFQVNYLLSFRRQMLLKPLSLQHSSHHQYKKRRKNEFVFVMSTTVILWIWDFIISFWTSVIFSVNLSHHPLGLWLFILESEITNQVCCYSTLPFLHLILKRKYIQCELKYI